MALLTNSKNGIARGLTSQGKVQGLAHSSVPTSSGTSADYSRLISTLSSPVEETDLLAEQKEAVARRISNAQTRIADAGYEVPEYEKEPNKLWQGVMAFLNTYDRPRNAIVNALQAVQTGENSFLQGLKEGFTREEEVYVADLLENAGVRNELVRGIAGFIGDVALDPLTYATFGTGPLAKGFVTGIGRKMTRSTADTLLRSGASSVVDDVLKAELRDKKKLDKVRQLLLNPDVDSIVKSDAQELLRFYTTGEVTEGARRAFYNLADDKEKVRLLTDLLTGTKGTNKGISFAGKEFVSGDTMQDLGSKLRRNLSDLVDDIEIRLPSPVRETAANTRSKIADTAAATVRGLRNVLSNTEQKVRSVFSPKGRLSELGEEGELLYQFTRQAQGRRMEGLSSTLDEIFTIFAPWRGKDKQESLERVRKALESTSKEERLRLLKTNQEKVLYTQVRQLLTKWGLKEQDLGMLSDLVEVVGDTGYLPHVANWDQRTNLWRGGRTKQFDVHSWHKFSRKYKMKIDDINELLYKKDPEKYGKHFIETNVVRILVDRAVNHWQVVSDKEFLNKVFTAFGKKVTDGAELMDDEVIVVPRQIFRVYKLKKGTDEVADRVYRQAEKLRQEINNIDSPLYPLRDLIEPALTRARQIGDDISVERVIDSELTTATKKIADYESRKQPLVELTKQQVEALGVAIKDLEAYALPRQMVEYINNNAVKQIDEGISTIENVIDRFYKIWKPTVTGLRPTYHIINIMGATWNNFLDIGMEVLNPKLQAAALKLLNPKANGTLKIGGKTYTYKQLRSIMEQNNIFTTFMRTDTSSLRELVERQTRRTMGEASTVRGIATNLGKAVGLGQALGGKIEEQVRAVNFLAHLKRGATIEDAAEHALRYHFDYTELTEAEKRFFRRLFPFYTWLRKNFPLQVEELLNQPGKYNIPVKAQQNMASALGVDTSNLPDWMEEQIPIPLTTNEETGRVTYLTASPPYADLAQATTQDVVSMLTPLIKVPMELYTGQSLLTGAPLQRYEGETKRVLGMEMSTGLAHALSQFGTIRDLSNTLEAPEGLPTSVVTPRQGYRDALFGVLREYSPEAGELSRQYEYNRQLENFIQRLKDMGVEVRDVNTIRKENKYRALIKSSE